VHEEGKERTRKGQTILGVVDGNGEVGGVEDVLAGQVLLDNLGGRSLKVLGVIGDADDQEPRREDGLPLRVGGLTLVQTSGSLDLPHGDGETVERS
jgi:hypothetical protein